MPSDDPTKRYRRFAAMVLVSDRTKEVDLCRRCAKELRVLYKRCRLDEAANTVTRFRPFVLLTDEATCDEAGSELEIVARVAGAELIVLTEPMTRDYDGLLMPALKNARERLRA